jgi:hypothetical protein
MRKLWNVFVAMVLVAGFAATASAGVFSYTTVADWNTPIPNAGKSFTGFTSGFEPCRPSQDANGNVAFVGAGPVQYGQGVYLSSGGQLSAVADISTPTPDGLGVFGGFYQATVDNQQVAFFGYGSDYTKKGIYITGPGGSLTAAADVTKVIPGGSGPFYSFGSVSSQGSTVLFDGYAQNGASGVYLGNLGSISSVVDGTTPQPGGSGKFSSVGGVSASPSSAGNGSYVAFWGSNAAGTLSGIYEAQTNSSGSGAFVVADTNTIAPGTGKTFSSFAPSPTIYGAQTAFHGHVIDGTQGIYLFQNGPLGVIADLTTPVPGGTGNFTDFGDSTSVVGNQVAFEGYYKTGAVANEGIYLEINGLLAKVIATGDQLDGKSVSHLVLGTHSFLYGMNQIVFRADFSDGTSGIYLAGQPMRGDANLDGVVNGLDIASISSHWLQKASTSFNVGTPGDVNYDGVVNGLDVAMVAANWLESSGAGAGAAAPEPATWLLLSLGTGISLTYGARAGCRRRLAP